MSVRRRNTVYITGTNIQLSGEPKLGPQWVETDAYDDLEFLLKEYEFREGRCSEFNVRIVWHDAGT